MNNLQANLISRVQRKLDVDDTFLGNRQEGYRSVNQLDIWLIIVKVVDRPPLGCSTWLFPSAFWLARLYL